METIGSIAEVERLVGSDRVLAVLKELARHPNGVGLDELSRAMGSAKPTVHRALVALRRAGLADHDVRGHYVLGDEFLRLAFIHHEARPDHVRILPVLSELATAFGETAHYAVLDGYSIVYRSKVDPPSGAVRLTSTVGGRNPAHTTAVGKLLLAHRLTSSEVVEAWVGAARLERRTAKSKCSAPELIADLEQIRARGFGTDDQENEEGVTCIAVPVFLGTTSAPSGAVSVSALAYRTPLSVLVDAAPRIRAIVAGRPGEQSA
ncbi:MAG: IclR family transcriptional regulator [bacterium]|nr:IclR family transcriptional regulator [bacterium]